MIAAAPRALRAVASASALLVLFACGTNPGGTDGGPRVDSGVDAGTCSTDSSGALAVGKFTQYVAATTTTNVLIFRSDCRWCADAIVDGASQALSSEGTWSSANVTSDAGPGIEVDKTNSIFFNILSSDGATARSYRTADGIYSGFEYARQTSSPFTCDGQ